MAIHCHSARYHYDSFHSRGGDVINIGSNNTYNIFGGGYNLGFGGYSIFGSQLVGRPSFFSSFGISLGWSLGSGLMNWLGNGLSGGGWNPAGIFAGGSFGFGNGMGNFGMGMNPWSSFGWGGSTGRGGSASGTTSHNDCVDSDRQKINQIGSKVLDLQKNDKATRDDAVRLYNEIKKAKDNTNDIHKDTDTQDYQNWMDVLNSYAKTKGWGNDLSKPASEARGMTIVPAADNADTPPVQEDDNSERDSSAAGATPPTENVSAQEDNNKPWSSIQSWGSNTLTDSNITLPSGYDKISDNDNITEVKITKEIKGTMNPVEGNGTVSSDKYENTNYPLHISIHDNVKNMDFVYKCVGKTKDGNPVYATPSADSNNNIYVLAKKGNSFELIQLPGFTGLNVKDLQNG